jgi:hypothetical protein
VLVLVEESAETVVAVDAEQGELVMVGDRFGSRAGGRALAISPSTDACPPAATNRRSSYTEKFFGATRRGG